MERETFEVLAHIAMEQIEGDAKGMRLFLSAGDDMLNFFDDNQRIKNFLHDNYLLVSQNERSFHLVGFLDAICWLLSLGYIDTLKQADYKEFPLEAELIADIVIDEIVREK